MEKPKKMDRRTRYTRQTIKDIFLEELQTKPYGKITVTELPQASPETICKGLFHQFLKNPKKSARSL